MIKLQEEKKQAQAEEFKRKQEVRKNKQKQLSDIKIQQEKEIQEELEKRNKDREIAKKIALEKWHQQKREEEKKRKAIERVRVKTERHKYFPVEYTDDKFKEYEKKQNKQKIVQMLKEYNKGNEFIPDFIAQGKPPKKIRMSSHHYSINDFIFS